MQTNRKLILSILKQTYFFAILAIGSVAIFVYVLRSPRLELFHPPFSDESLQILRVGEHTFKVYKADTPGKQARGLMNVRELPKDRGMLFTFPAKRFVDFYNKNILIPLDIIWIRDGKVVGFAFLPPMGNNIMYVFSKGTIDGALEVHAGSKQEYGIHIGDRVYLY